MATTGPEITLNLQVSYGCGLFHIVSAEVGPLATETTLARALREIPGALDDIEPDPQAGHPATSFWGSRFWTAAKQQVANGTSGDWMQTATGKRFWPLDPKPSDVCIEDIAHALSLTTRFGGHCLRFYSVAEHSVHLARAASPEVALWALLHDGSEAYLPDIVRPLKRHLPDFAPAEDRVLRAICEHFGLEPFMPDEVHDLDRRILIDERAQVMLATGDTWNYSGATEPLGIKVECWPPEVAKREFLAMFATLTGAASKSAAEWHWYASSDNERFTVGPEASREAVIAEATAQGLGEDFRGRDEPQVFYILEATQYPIDLASVVDSGDAIERLYERLDEDHGDPEGDSLSDGAWTADQEKDLAAMLDAALAATVTAWQDKHGIVVTPYLFNGSRNRETITLDRPEGTPVDLSIAVGWLDADVAATLDRSPGYPSHPAVTALPGPAISLLKAALRSGKQAICERAALALEAAITRDFNECNYDVLREFGIVSDGTAETTCAACAQPVRDGDPFYEDVNEGPMHAACCGPEREAFVGADGEPLKPGDPIPAPGIFHSAQPTAEG